MRVCSQIISKIDHKYCAYNYKTYYFQKLIEHLLNFKEIIKPKHELHFYAKNYSNQIP